MTSARTRGRSRSVRVVSDRTECESGAAKILPTLVNGWAHAPYAVHAHATPHRRQAAQPRTALEMKEDRLRTIVGRLREQDSTTAVATSHRLQSFVPRRPRIRLARTTDCDARSTQRQSKFGRDSLHRGTFFTRRVRASHTVIHIAEKDRTVPKRDGKAGRIGASGKRKEPHALNLPKGDNQIATGYDARLRRLA